MELMKTFSLSGSSVAKVILFSTMKQLFSEVQGVIEETSVLRRLQLVFALGTMKY